MQEIIGQWNSVFQEGSNINDLCLKIEESESTRQFLIKGVKENASSISETIREIKSSQEGISCTYGSLRVKFNKVKEKERFKKKAQNISQLELLTLDHLLTKNSLFYTPSINRHDFNSLLKSFHSKCCVLVPLNKSVSPHIYSISILAIN